MLHKIFAALAPALAVATAPALPAQDPDFATVDTAPGGPPDSSPARLPEGMSTEQMWPPPTEEDWRKPVLVQFERTWGDAVAVARETNKPILVCVNMDGEIASEHYAGVHYRSPETARLFSNYVCVIASVYRHNPRDYDAQGNRILCPRLGSVTCGEHIAIEPLLYEKFMDGQRIAPRHIMVELDGHEVYDVFYAWDNRSVFDTIDGGIAAREAEPRTVVRGDRPILERVASRAREDRQAVERAYREGDRAMREQLLRQAIAHPEAAPVGLLRLAVFDVDEELAGLARQALVKIDSPSAVDLLGEALRVPLPDAEREALLAALDRLRAASPRARLLANVHRGLDARSQSVDVQSWRSAIAGGAVYQPADSEAIERRAEAREAAAAADPGSAEALLGLAETSLELVLDPSSAGRYGDARSARRYGQLLFEDAKRHAAAARQAGASGWRVDAVEALCEYYIGDADRSYELAIQAAAAMPPEPASLVAVSTLALFAEARIDAIWKALRNKTDWPGEWMTDVNSAFAVLARHPLGTDVHAVTHFDFLNSLGAKRRAGAVLEQAIERFPASAALHDRLRTWLLEEQGLAALPKRYAELLAAHPEQAALHWFAGYAGLVEAEFHRRDNHPEQAVEAYRRAISHLDASIEREPAFQSTADHFAALALAGLARLSIEAGDLDAALELSLQGIARSPQATPVLDGLEISPAQTARLLEARLEAAGKREALARLREVLGGLDPVLLEPPAYEKEAPDLRRREARRPGR